jgi:hypothetical protein
MNRFAKSMMLLLASAVIVFAQEPRGAQAPPTEPHTGRHPRL